VRKRSGPLCPGLEALRAGAEDSWGGLLLQVLPDELLECVSGQIRNVSALRNKPPSDHWSTNTNTGSAECLHRRKSKRIGIDSNEIRSSSR